MSRPLIPRSNSKIKPPYIPPPQKKMSRHKLSYHEYLDMESRANVWEKEARDRWEEVRELRERIDILTPPLWHRVVAWLVSFAGAFLLAELILKWTRP